MSKKYIKRSRGELKKDKIKLSITPTDPLTVSEGTLDTAFNIKQYCKLREQTPKHGIFTRVPVHPVTAYQTNISGAKKLNKKQKASL